MSPLHRLKHAIGFNPLAWLGHTRRMHRRVRDYLGVTTIGIETPHCLVIVTPWQGTGIPWYSLAMGLMLSASGTRVAFVIDDQRFGGNRLRHLIVLTAICSVMAVVARQLPVIRLSDIPPATATSSAIVDRLAALNAIWALRGETMVSGRAAFEAASQRQLVNAHGRITAVLERFACDVIFVPGGVYGTSGLWVDQARRHGIRIASYDNGGYGYAMLATDGLACHLADVPAAFRAIGARCAASSAEHDQAMASANSELRKRQQGTDLFMSQMTNTGSIDAALRGGVLLALNSSWDSAALGLHVVFKNNTEWIVETVRYLLETTTVPVIVRQHPAERLPFAHTSDDYKTLLERNFGNHSRLYFIAAEDPINSYELMDLVGSVVVHTSTIGTEAAAFGKPVVTGSAAYYAGLGFVWSAGDLATYRARLDDAAAGRLIVTGTMRDAARLCFYVTQCCNWVTSTFNPEQFKIWSRISLDTLATDPPVSRALDAIRSGTPVAVLNHIARTAQP